MGCLDGKRVLLGIGGGIAAYKCADLVRRRLLHPVKKLLNVPAHDAAPLQLKNLVGAVIPCQVHVAAVGGQD